MRVVLRESTHSGETMQRAGQLVAVHGSVLGEPHREVAIAARALLVDEDVHRAVHRLQVVVDAVLGDRALLVALLVQVDGREHPLLVGHEVVRLQEEVLLRDVRGVDVRVAVRDMATPGVLLHLAAHEPTARVPYRQPRADLVGEREQVELAAELAVVALGGFLEPRLVGAQIVLGRPRRAVDPLELGVLLAPPPVRAGDAGQRPAVADHARARHVRAAAEVLPDRLAVAVHVVVDRELAGADLDGRPLGSLLAALQTDQLEFERLVDEFGAGLLVADDPSHEALAFADDARHLLVDGLEVIRRERLLDAEVVVEAVRDGRADPEVRLRIDPLHGLREDVRRRVAEDAEPVGAVDGHRLDGIRLVDQRREVFELAVHPQRDDGAIGEQGESVGGELHVEGKGGVSHGELSR